MIRRRFSAEDIAHILEDWCLPMIQLRQKYHCGELTLRRLGKRHGFPKHKAPHPGPRCHRGKSVNENPVPVRRRCPDCQAPYWVADGHLCPKEAHARSA